MRSIRLGIAISRVMEICHPLDLQHWQEILTIMTICEAQSSKEKNANDHT